MGEGTPFKPLSERRRDPYKAEDHLEATGGRQKAMRGPYGAL